MMSVDCLVVDCSGTSRLTYWNACVDEIGKVQKENHSFFCDGQSDLDLMEPFDLTIYTNEIQ